VDHRREKPPAHRGQPTRSAPALGAIGATSDTSSLKVVKTRTRAPTFRRVDRKRRAAHYGCRPADVPLWASPWPMSSSPVVGSSILNAGPMRGQPVARRTTNQSPAGPIDAHRDHEGRRLAFGSASSRRWLGSCRGLSSSKAARQRRGKKTRRDCAP
jgi:hypothetical protein